MDNTKSGYTTTEFWFSVISVGAILLKLAGVDVSSEDQSTLATSLAGLAVGFLAVWGIVSRYIKGRSEVKKAALDAEVVRLAVKAGKPVTLNLGRSR